jgi:hypothetical protein
MVQTDPSAAQGRREDTPYTRGVSARLEGELSGVGSSRVLARLQL